jgi:SseB protein N-terminal domain
MLNKLREIFGSSKAPSGVPDPQPLLRAIEAIAKADNPGSRGDVYREMLNAWFWFCVPELPEGWKLGMAIVTSAPTQIAIPFRTNAAGEKIWPVFTDPAALANYDPNTPHMALSAKEIFQMAVNTGVEKIVINPYDPVRKPIRAGGTVTRSEFLALSEGRIPKTNPPSRGEPRKIPAGTEVAIGRSANPLSEALRKGIIAAGAQCPEVEKIYRYHMVVGRSGPGSDVLAILSDVKSEEQFSAVVARLMAVIQPLLPPDQFFDITRIPASNVAFVEKNAELLYDRN